MSRIASTRSIKEWGGRLFVGIVLVLSAAFVVTQLQVTADLESFLPLGADEWVVEGEQWDPEDTLGNLILIAVEGGEGYQRSAISRALADLLRTDPRVRRVMNGDADTLTAVPSSLLPYRYLLSPGVSIHRFSREILEDSLAGVLRKLSGAIGFTDQRLLMADPTGEVGVIVRQWAGASPTERDLGVWVSPDGERALLLVEVAIPASDLDAQEALLDEITIGFGRLPRVEGLALLTTGQGVFAVQSRALIRAEVLRLTAVASLLVVFVLAVAFRSPLLILLSVMPLASALLVASAVVGVLFGGVHGITLAFGVTLLGVAVDYPIHLFGHRRQGEMAGQAMQRIWPTLRLGLASSVLGYSAMVFSSVAGLVQLGIFAISGLVAAALFSRFLLPWMLPTGVADTERVSSRYRFLHHSPAWGSSLVLAFGMLAATYLLLQRDAVWEDNLSALSPLTADSVLLDARLRADIGAPDISYMALFGHRDSEGVLQASEELAENLDDLVAHGVITGFDHPAVLLPSARTQMLRRTLLPPDDTLVADLESAASNRGFLADAFEPFLRDIEIARTLEPLRADAFLSVFPEIGLQRHLIRSDDGWVGIVSFRGVTDPEYLRNWFAGRDDGWQYVDLKRRVEQSLVHVRDEALQRFVIGAFLIVALLGAGLRSPRRGLKVAGPALLAALVTAAVLVALGESLSLFHLVSLLLVVGLGLDYALFFHSFGGESEHRWRARRALIVCALSTMVVFGTLATSPLPVLKAIGVTVALGAFFAWVFALLMSQSRNAVAR
jgi:predicted exporter